MLVREEDIAVVLENEIGNRGDHTFAVGAGDQKNGGVVHKDFCRFSSLQKRLPPRALRYTKKNGLLL
jgi:hypothetical protein